MYQGHPEKPLLPISVAFQLPSHKAWSVDL
jgi:hypothetical protein